MTEGKDETRTWIGPSDVTGGTTIQQADEALLKAGALQKAIFNSAISRASPLTRRASFKYSTSARSECSVIRRPK